MNAACKRIRETLLDRDLRPVEVGNAGGADAALRQHLATCRDCAALACRLERMGRALGELERLSAPVELEGRIVAALQAGHRQERAVAAVRSLERKSAPVELPRLVEDEGSPLDPELAEVLVGARVSAPDVLERLVRDELSDPGRSLGRRSIGSLPRLSAPDELAERVEADLRTPRRRPSLLRGPAQGLGLLTAAAALLFLVTLDRGGPEGTSGPAYSFQVVRVDSLDELDPLAREMVDGLTGGALTAHRAAAGGVPR